MADDRCSVLQTPDTQSFLCFALCKGEPVQPPLHGLLAVEPSSSAFPPTSSTTCSTGCSKQIQSPATPSAHSETQSLTALKMEPWLRGSCRKLSCRNGSSLVRTSRVPPLLSSGVFFVVLAAPVNCIICLLPALCPVLSDLSLGKTVVCRVAVARCLLFVCGIVCYSVSETSVKPPHLFSVFYVILKAVTLHTFTVHGILTKADSDSSHFPDMWRPRQDYEAVRAQVSSVVSVLISIIRQWLSQCVACLLKLERGLGAGQ